MSISENIAAIRQQIDLAARRSGRTAYGPTPAGGADGRAGPSGPNRPTDCRPPADRNARAARGRTDRPTADQRPNREGRTSDHRARCALVARSLLARSSLAARCARSGAERSDSPEGAARGEAPHTPSGLMGPTAWAERGVKKTYLGARRLWAS